MNEGLSLKDDGTAALVIDGRALVIRRPKLGEFRKIRERLYEAQDANMQQVESPTDDTDAEARRAFLVALRAEGEAAENRYLEWLAEALTVLGVNDVPARDDLPAWAAMPTLASQLMAHWRDVPLASGDR